MESACIRRRQVETVLHARWSLEDLPLGEAKTMRQAGGSAVSGWLSIWVWKWSEHNQKCPGVGFQEEGLVLKGLDRVSP